MRMITFLSDFGDKDWFVGAVKGEIFKLCKDVQIIDITHKITPHDIRSAAFVVKSVYKNFPLGTIHLVVVDPGVGSKRNPIIVDSRGYFFVGPDNGVFSYVYNKRSKVYKIRISRKPSSTFHARDIFGPVAAKLSKGLKPVSLGTTLKNYMKFQFPKIRKKGKGIYGEVVYVDHFGNLITNILNDFEISNLRVHKKEILVKKSYSEGEKGQLIAVKGSCGFYEIVCNQGSAKVALSAKVGTHIQFCEKCHTSGQ